MKTKVLFIFLACCFVAGLAFAGTTADQATQTKTEADVLMPEVEVELPAASCAKFEERTVAELLAPEDFVVASFSDCVAGCWQIYGACMRGCIDSSGNADPFCVATCEDDFDSCKGSCSGYHYPWP